MDRLVVEHVSRSFGGYVALDDVSLSLARHERRAIIGPNGAGKTTLFNVIGGQLAPSRGRVALDGRDVTRLPVHGRAQIGLARTFQRNNIFTGLTVFENTRLSVQAEARIGHDWLRPAARHRGVGEKAAALLERVGLAQWARHRADELSYGDQRRLELAVALAREPTVLLVDEPTAGMSAAETAHMVRLLESLPREVSLLVVEHDMDVVMTLTESVTVLHHGQVLADGTWDAVRADPRVQEAYLGARRAPAARAPR